MDKPIPAAGPHRILLVEDAPLNQTLIATLLRRAGHSVALAANGDEAIQAVQRNRYDLVLMDVQMPVVDGLEATRRIRSLPDETCRTPIVALTADVQPHVIEACFLAGMDDYAVKPVERASLLTLIDRWARTPADVSAI
jgi:CheY-like chemotaxis protein